MNHLFARALFAFLALPGMIGIVIPHVLFNPIWRAGPLFAPGLAFVVLGTALLLWCVREFYVSGKGTLAPWSPPRHLVTTGPYRFSRNPMYVAMSAVLIGWAVAFRSPQYGWYALFMMLAFHVRILLGEEPTLARKFGDAWSGYKTRAPRWIGRWRPGVY
jgi:protein-S-isoprenylcysteine O-methyltransferase Ste14